MNGVNYRGLSIPHVSFGAVTSDDLFCEKEQPLFDFYERNRDRYKMALDIGANIGVHSILMARQGWKVWAFEPDPELVAVACRNLREHGVDKDVSFYDAALSDHDGTGEFVRVLDNRTGSHLAGDKKPYGPLERITVKTLDARRILPWADFAKVDCEGHEARIFATVEPTTKCEMMIEVGTSDNADRIWAHMHNLRNRYRAWAQKSGWERCRKRSDMPQHHSEGAVFIGFAPPFP